MNDSLQSNTQTQHTKWSENDKKQQPNDVEQATTTIGANQHNPFKDACLFVCANYNDDYVDDGELS